MTTDKEMIALCAKALGYKHEWEIRGNGSDTLCYREVEYSCIENPKGAQYGTIDWNPRTDQLDSDNMACDLEIETSFLPDSVYCFAGPTGHRALHDGTIESRRAAVREARVLVAAIEAYKIADAMLKARANL